MEISVHALYRQVIDVQLTDDAEESMPSGSSRRRFRHFALVLSMTKISRHLGRRWYSQCSIRLVACT